MNKTKHKEKVIQTAIQEYKDSVVYGFSLSTPRAINGMEQAYIMCAPFNIRGIDELKNTINEARERFGKELSAIKEALVKYKDELSR